MNHRKHREVTKDDWRTPASLFTKLHRRFQFTGDACASSENTLCNNFFSEDDNALEKNWSELGSSVFINPPYSETSKFIARCWAAVRDGEVRKVVALVPSTCEVKWFHKYVLGKASEVWFTRGRIDFIHPETQEPISGNVVGSCLVVWEGASTAYRSTSFYGLCSKSFLPTDAISYAVWFGGKQVELFLS